MLHKLLLAAALLLVIPPALAVSVLFITPGRADEAYWATASAAMEQAAASLGMKLEILYAERDHVQTVALARGLASRPNAQRPDYLIINNDNPPLVFDIHALDSGSQVGTLELAPNREYFASRVWQVVLSAIVDYLILTLLICLIVGWVLRRKLEYPLQQIARFVTRMKPNELAHALVVDRHRERGTVDEIDLVVQGFNRMQDDLRKHIEALDDAVLDRTRQLSAALEEIRQL